MSLGEGGTPLLPVMRFGREFGFTNLWVKDEAHNPTQSFKARGMTTAVSMAKYLGAKKLAVPTAGQRRRSARRLRGARRIGGAHFHAPRYAAGQYHRMPRDSARTSP